MLLRNRIARGVAAGALVLALPTLTACGDFATDKVYTPAPGANDRAGDVDVLNAVIVATQDGHGTFLASFSNNLDSNVVNEFGDVTDTLVSIDGDFEAVMPGTEVPDEGATPDGTQVEETSLRDKNAEQSGAEVAPVVIRGSQLFRLGTKGDAAGIPVNGDFKIGDFVPVTLTFENAGEVVITVPVLCNAIHWEGEDTNPVNAGAELAPTCVSLEGGEAAAEGGH
ncbi:hypothetical protein [Nocardioides alcanivorans]|uniref:hypothetical protein n=1 Tax=Nocardioides alcanivorans TaxID=2897352 RepID=UPI001F38DBCF|nr:hypothetical protein [Nocardioides alcanivorans]